MLYRRLGALLSAQTNVRRRLTLAALSLVIIILCVVMPWGAALVVTAIACGAAIIHPVIGIALALVVGPAKALMGASVPAGLHADPGQVLVGLATTGWILRGLSERRLRVPVGAVAASLLTYVAIGAISLWGAADLVEGVRELLKWLQIVAVAVIVVDLRHRRQTAWILAAALIAGALQASVGLWQFALRGTGPEAFEIADGRYRAYGTFEQPNPFGGFMGLVLPLAFAVAISGLRSVRSGSAQNGLFSVIQNLAPNAAGLVVAMVTGIALFASYSRGAWLGALAAGGMMLVFWPRRRWLGISFAVAGLTTLLFLSWVGWIPTGAGSRLDGIAEFAKVSDVRGVQITSSNFSLIERIAHWQAAVRMARAHPWLGVGLGNFEASYPDFRLANWRYDLGHAHNVYLNVLAETGLIGLSAYILFWGIVFAWTLRALDTTQRKVRTLALGLLGVWTHLAVHNLVDNLLVNNVHLYIGSLLGMLSILLDRSAMYQIPLQRDAKENTPQQWEAELGNRSMRINWARNS